MGQGMLRDGYHIKAAVVFPSIHPFASACPIRGRGESVPAVTYLKEVRRTSIDSSEKCINTLTNEFSSEVCIEAVWMKTIRGANVAGEMCFTDLRAVDKN